MWGVHPERKRCVALPLTPGYYCEFPECGTRPSFLFTLESHQIPLLKFFPPNFSFPYSLTPSRLLPSQWYIL
nr:MAG TPA: hypothetical protein [Caudoviricetes sp.]